MNESQTQLTIKTKQNYVTRSWGTIGSLGDQIAKAECYNCHPSYISRQVTGDG